MILPKIHECKAILFDLDGTLIDTTELILYCFNHAWQTVCGRTHPPEVFIATMGVPLKDAMGRLLETTDGMQLEQIGELRSAGIMESLVQEYRACNAANHDRLACRFPAMGGVLPELRDRGYALGVVTSKSRQFAERGLRLCSLWEFINVFISMDDTTRHKPHPEPLLSALEKLQVMPKQAVYVGDSRHDMQAGRAAGMRTVAALWGPLPRSELELESPDVLASRPEELLEIFPAK
ncbi:MAG TPA: HAD-IA family hydrolase [Terriglobia bacterium]|nr:HAD-IA family hydrolase [Terriglobia bacterium]